MPTPPALSKEDRGRRRTGTGLRRVLRSVDVGREGLLRRLDDRREGRRLVDRELREDATVDLDAREGEALDEAVVGQAVLTRRRVDALDPETTEVALALATVVVRVDERVGDLLLGLAVEARPLTAVASARSRMTRRFLWALTARLTLAISYYFLTGRAAQRPSSLLMTLASGARGPCPC